MIVEFVGVPGAGKTTVARLLGAAIQEDGGRAAVHFSPGLRHSDGSVVGLREARLAAAAQILRRPALGGLAFRARKRRHVNLIANLAPREGFVMGLPCDGSTHILDEGPLHGVVMAEYRGLRVSRRLLSRLHKADLAIVLRVDLAEAARRTSERVLGDDAHWYTGPHSVAGLRRYEQAVHAVMSRAAIDRVEVDSADAADKLARRLVAHLRSRAAKA